MRYRLRRFVLKRVSIEEALYKSMQNINEQSALRRTLTNAVNGMQAKKASTTLIVRRKRYPRYINPEGLGVASPQILGMGSRGKSQGGRGGCGRVLKYYYILLCTGNMFKSGEF